MKKHFISLGLLVASTLALTNCAKEIDQPGQNQESAGIPFEITATTVNTKTVNDGLNTVWVKDDALNVFHASDGATTYVNDKSFKFTEDNTFEGTLDSEPTGKTDWYAFYPYSQYITKPTGTGYTDLWSKNGLTQNGNDSKDHLAGKYFPMYGKATVDAGDAVAIDMNHAVSVLEVVVKNTTDASLTVTDVAFTATEAVAGQFYINFAGDEVTYNPREGYVSNVAMLNVSNADPIEKGELATFYIGIKPFVATAGSTLYLNVNGTEKEIELSKDVVFSAGKIKTINYTYDRETLPDVVSVEEFLDAPVSSTWYQLEGTITSIVNTTYGNFYLEDETASVYVYGLLTEKGGESKKFESLGLKVGDVVTLVGQRSVYGSTPQVGNAYYVSHVAACIEPQISCVDNVVTITAEAGTTIYYTIDGSDPTVDSFEYTEPFDIEDTYTVKAIATADGRPTSSIASKICSYVDPNGGEEDLGTPSTTACYTLSTTGSLQGSNNSYAGNCDVTVDGIKWNANGNTQMNPWRFGGKSITKQDRTLYTKTAYPTALSKVEFVTGTVSVSTWHSLTLVYSTNSNFSNAQTMVAPSVGANKTIEFVPEGGFPANCYYKFILNVTVSGSSNKFVQMKEVKFYGYEN